MDGPRLIKQKQGRRLTKMRLSRFVKQKRAGPGDHPSEINETVKTHEIKACRATFARCTVEPMNVYHRSDRTEYEINRPFER